MRFYKILEIRKEIFPAEYPDLRDVSEQLDNPGSRHFIDQINWKIFNFKPEVRFSISYSNREIFLKYYVNENYFKAEKTNHNEKVWEDSCVEFFIEPAGDGIYYNMEFNAIGTCYMGVGRGREDRNPVVEEIISELRILPSLEKKTYNETEGNISWNLTIAIPFVVFCNHNIETFQGREVRANFYKCGDKLKIPHYLSWNPVRTPAPDFHRPEYFGVLKFI